MANLSGERNTTEKQSRNGYSREPTHIATRFAWYLIGIEGDFIPLSLMLLSFGTTTYHSNGKGASIGSTAHSNSLQKRLFMYFDVEWYSAITADNPTTGERLRILKTLSMPAFPNRAPSRLKD